MLPIIIVTIIVASIITAMFNKPQNLNTNIDPELARAMEYPKVQDGDENIDNLLDENGNSYVQFDAFFLRDLTEDGVAEGVRGTCKKIGTTDTLYMELKVNAGGYIEDGATIKINGDKNFYFETTIVKDKVVKNNYVGTNIETIELEQVNPGTQKLLTGIIKADISNNIYNYSKKNSITFSGMYVPEEGEKIKIEKTIEFQVDWYGTIENRIIGSDDYQEDLSKAINSEEKTFTVEHNIEMYDANDELILKKAHMEGTIPLMNEVKPIKVEITGTDIDYTYNEDSMQFTIDKEAEVDETGNVTKQAYGEIVDGLKTNKIHIKIIYPLEAYLSIGADSIFNYFIISGYYEGYNLPDTEGFDNPYTSDTTRTIIAKTYMTPSGGYFLCNIKVGKANYKNGSLNYSVSKEKPLKIYNGISEEENDDTYEVEWNAKNGIWETLGYVLSEVSQDGKYDSDVFVKADGTTQSMENFVSNIGVRLEGNFEYVLGEEGWIKIYDDEKGELLVTFTKDNWEQYMKDNYRFEIPVKHIRVETSETNSRSSLSIICIKEIDTEYIVQNYSQEEFNEFLYIRSKLNGYALTSPNTFPGGSEQGGGNNTAMHVADYSAPYSSIEVNCYNRVISTQKTEENVIIYINVGTESFNREAWQDGIFLLKMPEHIIDVKVNEVIINANNNVNGKSSYELYEENNIKYIKIRTKLTEPTSYKVALYCDLTADPRMSTTTEYIDVYGYNELASSYENPVEDIYDINGNLNTGEMIDEKSININMVAPSTLITSETVTNYDGDKIAIAPQIAEVITKQKTADININIENNYTETISEIVILGRVPNKGNKYVINGNDLKSDYTVSMQNTGIIVPEELKDEAKVYYSENADATNDLKDIDNGWITDPKDFSNIKSYLIDLGEYKLKNKEPYEFKYTIEMPEERVYEQVSYSHHAIYFSLDTTEGKYRTQTEPNKVGIEMTAQKCDLELTKYQVNEEKTIPGVTYSISREEGSEEKTAVTQENGILKMTDLYVGRTYILKEIEVPKTYELNQEEITFSISEDDAGLVSANLVGGNIKGDIKIIQAQEKENAKIQIQVEDEVKANLKILKTDEEENPIKNARFKVTGKNYENGIMISSNDNGEAQLSGLSIDAEYNLEEILADGYYLMKPIKFKIENNEGNYTANIIDLGENKEDVIAINDSTEEDKIPIINMSIKDEKIPRYSLIINKVEKDTTNPIEGVKFRLYKGTKVINDYTTNNQGKITIDDLYLYESSKEINQTYTLSEIRPIDGYSNIKNITFKVENLNGVLTMDVLEGKIKAQESKENNIIEITIENSPIFKLVKKDGETQTFLPNVKFAIYDNKTGEPAKNGKGEIIGEKQVIDGEEYYIVETNDKGEIVENLLEGEYKIIEMEAPEQYELGTIEDRTHYFRYNTPMPTKQEFKLYDGKAIGTSSNDSINSIVNTEDGGYIVGSNFKGESVVLPDGSTVTNESGDDFGLLIRFDNLGNIKWKVKNEEPIYIVTQTKQGAIYCSSQNSLFKYNNEGNYEWEKTLQYGVSYIDSYAGITAIEATQDEGCILAGRGPFNTASDRCGIKIIKYQENGNIEWEKSEAIGNYSQSSGGIVTGLAQLDNGSYVAVGTFAEKEIEFSNGEKITNNQRYYYEGSYDIYLGSGNGFVIEYNASGNIQDVIHEYPEKNIDMGSTLPGQNLEIFDVVPKGNEYILVEYQSNSDNYNRDIIVKSKSKVYCDIRHYSSYHTYYNNYYSEHELAKIKFAEDGGFIVLTPYGNLINKYDSENQLEWSIDGFEGMNDICQDGNGNYVVVGDFSEEINLYNNNLESIGNSDGILVNVKPIDIPIDDIPTVEKLEIENNLKEFEITTEVETINGVKGGNISGEGNGVYEKVKYGKNTESKIEMTPSEGYEIVKITINGVEQEFTTNGGTYILPQIVNVTENKHIVVTYMKTSNKLTIIKKDEKDSKTLAGAKFRIDQLETREQPTNVIGSIVNNGQEYKIADKTQDLTSDVMKEMIKNGNDYEVPDIENPIEGKLGAKVDDSRYYFVQNEDGTLTSNNGKRGDTYGYGNTTAHSYYEINLENYSGEDLVVVIEAKVSSERYSDYGYATITKSSSMPKYNESSGQFMKISGETERTSYTSQVLAKGTKNYLHLGYYKYTYSGDGEDKLTIYSIKVCGLTTGKYYFEGSGTGPYVSNNTGKAGTQANSCIPIDLTSYQGKYHLIINVEISCEYVDYYGDYDYGYIVIKDDSTMPSDPWSGVVTRELYGEDSGTYEKVLDGGKEYFLNFVYYKDEDNISDSGDDKFTINSINIYKEVTKSFGFEGTEPYTSNNVGERNTTANSYIPINLTGLSGKYQVTVNAEISSSGSGDYGYVIITTTDAIPSYNSGTSVIRNIYGKKGPQDYTAVIDGGYNYFLHFSYRKDSYEDSGDITDTFKINSVRVSLSDEGLYHEEATTNEKGEAIVEVPIGKYEITETEAPLGYELKEGKTEYTMKTEGENIVEITNKQLSKVTVHHYLKGTKDEIEPTRVAEDDIYMDKIGETYTTEPHLDLEEYELIKDEDGEYIIPEGAAGEYREDDIEVIYEYETRKIPLIVHHYIRGTSQKVPLPDNQGEAQDVKDAQVAGTAYTTEAITPDESYELVETPSNSTGIYKYPKVEVTYYYELKKHEITTKVKTHTEIDEYGQEIQVAGGTILGEGDTPYETVIHKGNSTMPLIATPEEDYQIKTIEINGRQLDENEYSIDENGDRSATLNEITNIVEDQEVVVEFEKRETQITVYHLVYDRSNNEYTNESVPLDNGDTAKEYTTTGRVGEIYVTNPLENIDKNYEVYEIPPNSSGIATKDPIVVKYYYALEGTKIIDNITKDGTEIITSKEEVVHYTINYTATIRNYAGKAVVKITDTLPYNLNQKEMEKMEGVNSSENNWLEKVLDGGNYDDDSKTITWIETYEGINTADEETGEKVITIEKDIAVIFKDIDTTQIRAEFTNKVKGKIELEEGHTKETRGVTHTTRTNFTKNIKVTKTWEHGNNTKYKPTQIILQIKNGENVVDSYIVSEQENWMHIFTGLPKYDAETGEEIEYTVDEQAIEGEEELLKYYNRH